MLITILTNLSHLIYFLFYLTCLIRTAQDWCQHVPLTLISYKILYAYPKYIKSHLVEFAINAIINFTCLYLFNYGKYNYILTILIYIIISIKLKDYSVVFRYCYYLYFTGPIIAIFYNFIHKHSQLIVLWLIKVIFCFIFVRLNNRQQMKVANMVTSIYNLL